MHTDRFAPEFSVIPAYLVRKTLSGRQQDVVALVERTYGEHAAGRTVNPQSMFLKFVDRPADRIIALPASLSGTDPVDGIKWIASVPGNTASGRPRASAVIILNDPLTGFPFACLEGSVISAARTAASAASAARWLTRNRPRPRRLGIVGTGVIARNVCDYLYATGWQFDSIEVHDQDRGAATRFSSFVAEFAPDTPVKLHSDATGVVADSELVVFATVAGQPYLGDAAAFAHGPVVLHLSLRDLAPSIILQSQNYVDDVEHCLRAGTSLDLAEQESGTRGFLSGTLAEVIDGTKSPSPSGTVVFSPFGLGVLDLAVARLVHLDLVASGELMPVPGFFDGTS